MFFLNSNEIDLKFVNYSTINRIKINKYFLVKNKYELVNPNIQIFYYFNRIIDLDFTKIYEYLLFL